MEEEAENMDKGFAEQNVSVVHNNLLCPHHYA
jgi:hypothetical protein